MQHFISEYLNYAQIMFSIVFAGWVRYQSKKRLENYLERRSIRRQVRTQNRLRYRNMGY